MFRSQRDFDDEIKAHLALETDRLRGQGMSQADAERAARRAFGNVGVAKDRFYHGRALAKALDFLRDIRHAWRGLRRTPSFLITAVLTLGLAIGAQTGMFSVVNAVLLRPLPFPNPDRLVDLAGTAPGSDLPERFGLGAEFYLHYRERSRLLDGLFVFAGGNATFRTESRAERIGMAWPSNDMYATLGIRPIAGRLPVPADGDDAVVISERLWTSWFGRDSSYLVAQWTREIGMRMALGATAGTVRRMIVSDGARVALAGIVIGLAVAGAATRALIALLFGVDATNPAIFVAMSGMMLGVGFLASYLPAHRASSVSPIESLRSD